MAGRILVFGATGYTGRKTVAELVKQGARPILAGRDAAKLAALAQLHGGLQTQVADVAKPTSVRALLNPGDILITTVGPFMRYGQIALDAALDAGAHYIDSTGEPAFIRRVYETVHTQAQKKNLLFLTAFGYDYVPGHMAAAAALEAAGPDARRIDIGYFMHGDAAVTTSDGTQASLAGAALDPGLFYRKGQLAEDFGGTRYRSFELETRQLDAISVPGSEHLWLPAAYPQLTEVGVYLGWFGKRSRTISRLSRLSAPLLRIGLVTQALKALVPEPKNTGNGPSDADLARSGSHIVACAYDAKGSQIARADLVGIDGYTYTARMLAWAAQAIARGAAIGTGALGPLGAFGYSTMLDANRSCGLELRVHPSPGAR